ncbi:MAG: GNAT family N-acetyltransferase [Chitinophagaceae bacterium]|nr:GNAT family N-acetyltransferase [Chitinophagaceae bacterium]
MKHSLNFIVRVATPDDLKYVNEITDAINFSAKKRGTGIDDRPYDYVRKKMEEGLAIIAIAPGNRQWAGFCCVEVWENKKYLANTGLIVSNDFLGLGVAGLMKIELFNLCRKRFPKANIFSLTANTAVIHLNKSLGFKEMPYHELLSNPQFVSGCTSWVDYVGMMTNGHGHLSYVAMVFDPAEEKVTAHTFDFRRYLVRKTKSVLNKKVLLPGIREFRHDQQFKTSGLPVRKGMR